MNKFHTSLFFFTCLFFSFSLVNAQNLVPNPSFETWTSCGDSISPVMGGSIINPWYGANQSTPDHYNASCIFGGTCIAFGTPCNVLGYQVPKSGTCYTGFISYEDFPLGCPGLFETGWREYLQVQLSEPMLAGTEYCVSFYVSLANNVRYASDGIGCYISSTPTSSGGDGDLGFTPQILHPTVISDTTNWVQVQGTYTATGGEQYIIIGSYGATGTAFNCGSIWPYAYYYLDDVSVFATCTSYSESAIASICAGDSIFLAGDWQTTSGVYIDELFSSSCCDSTLTTTLNVTSTGTSELTASICDGDSIFVGGAWQTIPGIYTDTYPISGDCDSTIITTLEFGDDEVPILSCPPDISVDCYEDVPNGYQLITQFVAAGGISSDNCALNLNTFKLFTQISDGGFCPEIFTRTYQITDLSGNVTICEQLIIIHDLELPELNCPSDVNLTIEEGLPGAYVEYVEPTATDNCSDVFAFLSSGQGSATTFSPGVNTEVWSAIDTCGNVGWCSFNIVIDNGTVVCNPPTGLNAAISSPTNVQVQWIAVPGAIRYHLKGRPVGSSGFAHSYPFGNFKNVGGLTPGQSYEWQVRVMCADSAISAFAPLSEFTMPLPGKYRLVKKDKMELSPNPASDWIRLDLFNVFEQKKLIRIYDVAGESVFRKKISVEEGFSSFKLNLPQLASGIYYLHLIGKSESLVEKLMKY